VSVNASWSSANNILKASKLLFVCVYLQFSYIYPCSSAPYSILFASRKIAFSRCVANTNWKSEFYFFLFYFQICNAIFSTIFVQLGKLKLYCMYTRDSIAVLWSKFFFQQWFGLDKWMKICEKNWMHDNFELFNMHMQEDGSIKNHLNGKIVHFRSILIFFRDKEWGINSSRRCLFNGLKTIFYHR